MGEDYILSTRTFLIDHRTSLAMGGWYIRVWQSLLIRDIGVRELAAESYKVYTLELYILEKRKATLMLQPNHAFIPPNLEMLNLTLLRFLPSAIR